MADVSTRKKKNALQGKGGLVMLAVMAALGIWLFFDLQKPPREAGAPPLIQDIIPIKSGDVKHLVLRRPSGSFSLVRSGDQWLFESPKPVRADSETINTWLKGLLDDGKVSRDLEGKPSDLNQFGLDKPAAELELTSRGGEVRTLQVGKDFRTSSSATPGSIFYAREAKSGKLFMLDSAQARDLTDKKWEDLRDKHLIALGDEKAIQHIVLKRPNDTVDVQRQGDRWRLTQPIATDADKMDVENLISQLKSTTADSMVDDAGQDLAKYGLDRPRLTVEVTDKKGASELRFGSESKEGKVYVMRPGDSTVALIPKLTFDGFNKKSADLRDRRLVTLDREKIDFLELHNGSGLIKLQRQGSDWRLLDVNGGKPARAKSDTVQRLIDSATSPAYKSVQEGTANAAQFGLDKPAITLRVSNGQATSQVLQIGKKSPDGNYYAQGAPSAVFEVQPFVYTDLDVKADAIKDTAARK